jgi:predicted RNase H-like HicB family nuclease
MFGSQGFGLSQTRPARPLTHGQSTGFDIKYDKILLKMIDKQKQQFTAIIEREDDGYVSLCPQLDIASQGKTIEEARNNLIEALELFFETADPSEIQRRSLASADLSYRPQ